MTPHKETNGKLLSEEEVKVIMEDVEKWMREPEQWRQLLTHRFNALLADRKERIEKEQRIWTEVHSSPCQCARMLPKCWRCFLLSLLSHE